MVLVIIHHSFRTQVQVGESLGKNEKERLSYTSGAQL